MATVAFMRLVCLLSRMTETISKELSNLMIHLLDSMNFQYDFESLAWAMDPLPVVRTIQGLTQITRPPRKREASLDDLLNEIQIKVTSHSYASDRTNVTKLNTSDIG